MKRFDRKFGVAFLKELPQAPGIYLFKDESGEALYVGKAKNLRKRLSDYRNASRRKAHRKRRILVRESATIEVRLASSETDALLLENELIRELRPPYNIDGAFDFLYPAIGLGWNEGRLLLCFTTEPEAVDTLSLRWHGSYRPRRRAKEAFASLVELFKVLGHLEPRSRLPAFSQKRGMRLVAVRRVEETWLETISLFLKGEDNGMLEDLALQLLERAAARQIAGEIEDHLRLLARFFEEDASGLREARLAAGLADSFVARNNRDALFIRLRSEDSKASEASN